MSVIGEALKRAEGDRRGIEVPDEVRGLPKNIEPEIALASSEVVASCKRNNLAPVGIFLIVGALTVILAWVADNPGGGDAIVAGGNHSLDSAVKRGSPEERVSTASRKAAALDSEIDSDYIPAVTPSFLSGDLGDGSANDNSRESQSDGVGVAHSRASGEIGASGSMSASGVSESNRFRLDGLMLGGMSKVAVINGAIVHEGQRVDGALVISINQTGVVIEAGGKRFRLNMQAAKQKP